MGMMAASGVRQGSLVQRAQMQIGSQKPRFTSGQVRNAGIAMGMMAASGKNFRGAIGETSPCNCKKTETLSDGSVLTHYGRKMCGQTCCGSCKDPFELAPQHTRR